MRMPPQWLALFLGALAVVPFAAELTLKLYTKYIRKRDRLLRSDTQTGWSNTPNLVTMQINAAGERWSIQTDQNGQRVVVQNPPAGQKILILGDSLSFGEGVNV